MLEQKAVQRNLQIKGHLYVFVAYALRVLKRGVTWVRFPMRSRVYTKKHRLANDVGIYP